MLADDHIRTHPGVTKDLVNLDLKEIFGSLEYEESPELSSLLEVFPQGEVNNDTLINLFKVIS